MSRNIATAAILVSLSLGLAGCGHSVGDRAISGGAIGAGAGVAAGAILGAPLLPAALIGGALGAGTGALTSPRAIDLGKPAWE